MARWSGEMEFEFADGQQAFVATDKVVTFLRGHLAKGQVQEAARLYEDSGATAGPALLTEARSASSSTQKALAEMFVLARDWKNAAAVFELARAFDRAAQHYEQGLDFANAARCYEQIHDPLRAAVCWERAGQGARAVELYKKAGPSQALAEALGRQGHYYDAALVYRHIFNLKAEVEMLRLVPMASESRVPATLRLAELLEQYHRPDQAVGLLIETIKTCEHARLHQPMYMLLASIFERMGRVAEAAQVRQRVQNLLGPASATSTSATSTAAPPPAAAAAPPPPTTAAPSFGHPPTSAPPPAAPGPTFGLSPAQLAAAPAPGVGPAPRGGAKDPFVALVEPFDGGPSVSAMSNNAYAHLKGIPIFAELDVNDMKELYRASDDVSFANGQVLVEQGVAGAGLYVIISGEVRVLRQDPTGSVELARLGAGAQVGELSLLDDAPTSARVVAHGDVSALFISRASFLQFVETRDIAAMRIFRLFARTLAQRLRQANVRK